MLLTGAIIGAGLLGELIALLGTLSVLDRRAAVGGCFVTTCILLALTAQFGWMRFGFMERSDSHPSANRMWNTGLIAWGAAVVLAALFLVFKAQGTP